MSIPKDTNFMFFCLFYYLAGMNGCLRQEFLSIMIWDYKNRRNYLKLCKYGNSSKFRTLFTFCSQIKCWLSRLELEKMLVRNANSEDPDQTASSEAV